jgi:hypothetical protein
MRAHSNNLRPALMPALLVKAAFLTTVLENLVRGLRQYKRVGGNGASLICLYKRQYLFIITCMCAVNALSSSMVETYSGAKANAAALVAAAAKDGAARLTGLGLISAAALRSQAKTLHSCFPMQ